MLALSRRAQDGELGIETRAADAGDFQSIATALAGETVDVLVYNAYRMAPISGPSALTPEALIDDMKVNVAGALAAAQAVLPGMRARGSGVLLFTGGGLAFDPTSWLPAASLAAGKAALRNLVFALHRELAPAGSMRAP